MVSPFAVPGDGRLSCGAVHVPKDSRALVDSPQDPAEILFVPATQTAELPRR